LQVEAGIRITHVPYKGAPQAISDVIGGHVDSAFASAPSVIASVQQGPGARASRQQRRAGRHFSGNADHQGEWVKDFDVNPWWGIFWPRRSQPIDRHQDNADVAEILKTPDFKEVLAKQGGTSLTSTPEEFSNLPQEGHREVGQDRESGRGQDELTEASARSASEMGWTADILQGWKTDANDPERT